MKGSEIRSSFLEFFRERGHEVVRSAPIVPRNDPTLLFTNAGMVPFKGVFLGTETREHSRAASAQKCLRLSGKHNDLEEVGRDTYHHTFFEMLGNWSFGDYGKREAIAWAWELLTDVWKLPSESLWVTVFRTDDEAEAIWREIPGMDANRVLRFDEKDNFWEMGATGPCGPCSEIHIDRGEGSCDRTSDESHVCAVNAGCARYIELWNLVFIQHNRLPDGSLEDLPSRHVDTGMGLERVAAVLQSVPGNYDADLLRDLIRATEKACGIRYGDDAERDVSFRVIADHIRAVSFMIADGVTPSNEGRGYVLRRVLRRAARHGKNLGLDRGFLADLTRAVADVMGDAYPELVSEGRRIADAVRAEEDRFAQTLGRGGAILDAEAARLREAGKSILDGETAFRLYDTYGFPLDLTEDILKADGIEVDREGFEKCMAEQRSRAREARKDASAAATTFEVAGNRLPEARFAGSFVRDVESSVEAIFVDGKPVDEAREGQQIAVVAAETPFYAEGGGQVGDRGVLSTPSGARVLVEDTQRAPLRAGDVAGDRIVHLGVVERGAIRRGEDVRLVIDADRREKIRRNHSATHVFHGALREVVGSGVRQAGSLVAPDRLRFDVTHEGPVDPEALSKVERLVNERIRENALVTDEQMPFDEAVARGALAFFGDKYGDLVRVVQMGDFSLELCGGTHVARTGDIGMFRLRGEGGVAAGMRRVEAVTGEGALAWMREREDEWQRLADMLKTSSGEVAARVERMIERERALERELASLRAKLSGSTAGDLLDRARVVDGVRVVAAEVDVADPKDLRDMADKLRERLGSGVVVLGSRADGKAVLLASVTKDLSGRYPAGDLIRRLAPVIGGRGGGKAEMAQAGGSDPDRIPEALEMVFEALA